ncbi:hypothetical protein D9M68_417550 [compost metagenome]
MFRAKAQGRLALALNEVHGRRPDEGCHEGVGRTFVDFLRGADLVDAPVVQDDDAVAQGQGLDLVVGDVDGGGFEVPLELLQFVARRNAQFGVQVGQRLVKQEHHGLAHHRSRKRHPLALPAGQLARFALQQCRDAEHLGRPVDFFLYRSAGHALRAQGKGDVAKNVQVRIERVALEHHGHVAGPGRQAGDDLAVEQDIARRRLFQARDHAQQRGFARA